MRPDSPFTVRCTAETIPVVTEFDRPKGLPIAITVSPIIRSDVVPIFAALRFFGSTVRTARSLSASAPSSFASISRPSDVVTQMLEAPEMTWSFVTTTPEESRITPEPRDSVL